MLLTKKKDKPWNWRWLSCSMSENYIKKHNYDWSWSCMSHNKSLSIEFIKDNIEKDWSWESLSRNTLQKAERDRAARIIQRKFLDWFYKPKCKDGTFGLNCQLAQRLCM